VDPIYQESVGVAVELASTMFFTQFPNTREAIGLSPHVKRR
jgi:hypothetical protein